MKEKNKVVAFKHLPTRLPVNQTVLWWLVLDKIHAPGWLWGVAGSFFALLWIAAVVGTLKEDGCEPAWKRVLSD